MYSLDSPEYKKARRKHLKTTKNRPSDIEDGWTPFRTMEKKFKAKWPPPDLNGVLDLSHNMDVADEVSEGQYVWRGRADAVEWREIGLDIRETGKRRAYVFPSVPGAKPFRCRQHMYVLI